MGNNPTPPPYETRKGRPAGSPNKSTVNAREAIASFVEGNVGRLNGLLDTIEAEDGAQAAWDCIVDVLEYHVPKLARTELTGKDGEKLAPPITNYYIDGVSSPHDKNA